MRRVFYLKQSTLPPVRFIGLVSPVGQPNLIEELISVVTGGLIHPTTPWPTDVNTSGTALSIILDHDLTNPVLPQFSVGDPNQNYNLTTLPDSHTEIGRDKATEGELWKQANDSNVPIPKYSSHKQ